MLGENLALNSEQEGLQNGNFVVRLLTLELEKLTIREEN